MFISKKQLIIFLVAIALIVGFSVVGFNTTTPKTDIAQQQASWPSREVEAVTFTETGTYQVINTAYPKTASDSITMYFKSFIDEQIAQFKEDTAWVEEFPESVQAQSLSLDISYTSTQATYVQTYVFVVNLYTGGAHGMQIRKTFSFNKEGQLLTISNVFKDQSKGLAALSELAQKELLKKEGTEASWVSDGAGPREENYSSFIITDDAITILFDPYQVGPYVLGALDITIPVKAFESSANMALFVAPEATQ